MGEFWKGKGDYTAYMLRSCYFALCGVSEQRPMMMGCPGNGFRLQWESRVAKMRDLHDGSGKTDGTT